MSKKLRAKYICKLYLANDSATVYRWSLYNKKYESVGCIVGTEDNIKQLPSLTITTTSWVSTQFNIKKAALRRLKEGSI